jgi:hypothetical protein
VNFFGSTEDEFFCECNFDETGNPTNSLLNLEIVVPRYTQRKREKMKKKKRSSVQHSIKPTSEKPIFEILGPIKDTNAVYVNKESRYVRTFWQKRN